MNVDWDGPGTDGHPDPAFPTLARVLAPVVPGAGPVAVYHYPGRTLQVVHLDGDGGLLTRDVPPLGAARALLGPGERWDAALHCTVRTFPHDPGLPALAEVVRRSAAGPDDVLAYLPGRRAVLRAGRLDDPLVVKIGEPASVRRNQLRAELLYTRPARGFRISRPRGLDPLLPVRFEELLPGLSLTRALTDGIGQAGRPVGDPARRGRRSAAESAESADLAADLAAERAVALAADLAGQVVALHDLDPHGLPLADHRAPVLLARLHRKTLRTLRRALPGLAPRAAAVVESLAVRPPVVHGGPGSGSVGPGPGSGGGVVHGDLHAANVLVGPAGAVLLDLDELGVGEVELDVAVLVGRLLLVAVATGRPDVLALARVFPAAYDAAAADRRRPGLHPDRFAWYLAGTLIGRQVKTSVRHLAPGLATLCDRLVGLAETVVADRLAGQSESAGLVDRLARDCGSLVPSGGLR